MPGELCPRVGRAQRDKNKPYESRSRADETGYSSGQLSKVGHSCSNVDRSLSVWQFHFRRAGGEQAGDSFSRESTETESITLRIDGGMRECIYLIASNIVRLKQSQRNDRKPKWRNRC